MSNHYPLPSSTLVWLAKEFAFTVSLSFMILTTVLWVFFDHCGSAPTISHTRLFGLIVACSTAVFVFMAACTWLLRRLFPAWVTSDDFERYEYEEEKELGTGLRVPSVGVFGQGHGE